MLPLYIRISPPYFHKYNAGRAAILQNEAQFSQEEVADAYRELYSCAGIELVMKSILCGSCSKIAISTAVKSLRKYADCGARLTLYREFCNILRGKKPKEARRTSLGRTSLLISDRKVALAHTNYVLISAETDAIHISRRTRILPVTDYRYLACLFVSGSTESILFVCEKNDFMQRYIRCSRHLNYFI